MLVETLWLTELRRSSANKGSFEQLQGTSFLQLASPSCRDGCNVIRLSAAAAGGSMTSDSSRWYVTLSSDVTSLFLFSTDVTLSHCWADNVSTTSTDMTGMTFYCVLLYILCCMYFGIFYYFILSAFLSVCMSCLCVYGPCCLSQIKCNVM